FAQLRRTPPHEKVERGEDLRSLRRKPADVIVAEVEGIETAEAADGAAAEPERRPVIGIRFDRAMDEHPSGLDPAPPRQRIEIILRLDDFVEIEEVADGGDLVRRVPDVRR